MWYQTDNDNRESKKFEVSYLRTQISELRECIKDLSNAGNAHIVGSSEARSEGLLLKEQLRHISNRNDVLTQSIQDLQLNGKTRDAEIMKLQYENESLKTQIQSLKKENETLRGNLEKLSEEDRSGISLSRVL
jgi:chromosome segregation ATPase